MSQKPLRIERTATAMALATATLLSAGAAFAGPEPTPPMQAEPSPRNDTALVVDLSVGESAFDPEAVRAAIARELGILVVSQSTDTGSRLEVRFDGPERAEVVFRAGDGRSVGRSIDLPEQQERAIETVALLAANLVRDEAAELIADLERRTRGAAPTAKQQEKPPELARPKALPSEPAAERRPSMPTQEPPKIVDHEPVNFSLFHPVSLFVDSERRSFNLEIGLVYGRVGGVTGFDLNTGVARADQWLDGVQLAGIMSWVGVGPFEGLQVAGGLNLTRGAATGGQLSSVNLAMGGLTGAQLGALNVASSAVDGLQLGFVNFSGRQRGVQVGLVNMSEELDGVPIGLVNVGGNTDTSMIALYTSRTPVNLGVKFLTGHVFSTVSAGCDRRSFSDGPCQHVLQGAWTFGGHLPLAGPFALEPSFGYAYEADVERPAESVNGGHVVLYRTAVHWQPVPALGWFGGGGARQLIDHEGNVSVEGELVAGAQVF